MKVRTPCGNKVEYANQAPAIPAKNITRIGPAMPRLVFWTRAIDGITLAHLAHMLSVADLDCLKQDTIRWQWLFYGDAIYRLVQPLRE